MSKRFIIIGLLICVVLGLSGGSYVAWRLYMKYTRDHPAMGVYRMEFPVGMDFAVGVAKVEEVMESDQVIRPVVQELELVGRFKVQSEDEAVALVREKLSLKAMDEAGRVRVMYRDRNYKQALEILKAIHAKFARSRAAQAVLRPAEP